MSLQYERGVKLSKSMLVRERERYLLNWDRNYTIRELKWASKILADIKDPQHQKAHPRWERLLQESGYKMRQYQSLQAILVYFGDSTLSKGVREENRCAKDVRFACRNYIQGEKESQTWIHHTLLWGQATDPSSLLEVLFDKTWVI